MIKLPKTKRHISICGGITALERVLQSLQAVKVGQEAVAEQCRAIDGWKEEVGKPKLQPSAVSTAALEAKIESLCRDRMEQVYKTIKGAADTQWMLHRAACLLLRTKKGGLGCDPCLPCSRLWGLWQALFSAAVVAVSVMQAHSKGSRGSRLPWY